MGSIDEVISVEKYKNSKMGDFGNQTILSAKY